jgi:hypothetical protein
MRLGGATRARQSSSLRHLVRTGLLTAAILPLAISLLLWQVPAGCNPRGDPAIYPCLLPGLLVTVPVGLALGAPIAPALNGRRVRPFPDG